MNSSSLTQSWLEKYSPRRSSEMMMDKENIKKIKQFLRLFYRGKDIDKIPNPNLIISGPNGVGKTCLVGLSIQEAGFDKVIPDISSVSVARKSKRKTGEGAGMDRSVNAFYSGMCNNRKMNLAGELGETKSVLFFDDISNISNPREREAIKAIVKMNNKLKQIPIIIVTNTQHSKFVGDLRKMVTFVVKTISPTTKKEVRTKKTNEIVVRHPSIGEMRELVESISRSEKLVIKNVVNRKIVEDDCYDIIVRHSQFDVRRLINILEELKLIYGASPVTRELIEKYLKTSKRKDIDPGIFEVAKTLLNDYRTTEEALHLYSVERAAIPLMVHENYPRNIKTQFKGILNELEKIRLIRDISLSISCSDRVDGIIYSNQYWSLQPVHGFHSCVLPSFYINQNEDKLLNAETYDYTKDFNKTSINKINKKVIKKAQEHPTLRGSVVLDFLFMATLLKKLLASKDFEAFAELMRSYRLKLKEIESIIKIDKIKLDSTKKAVPAITGKPRAHLLELLGVTE